MLQENLLKIYETSFRENREMSALTDYFKGETFSYYEMAKEIAKIHLLFKKAGIKQGDKIALIGRNNPRWCITYMGTITYGAVIVPILQDFTPADIIHIINHSESRLLFLGDNFWDVIEEDQIKQIEAVFSLTDFHAIYERDGKSLTKFQRDIVKNYRTKYPRGFSVNDIKYPEIPNDQVVLLNYTSGTTGYSKGVMLTVNNLTSNVMFAATTINTLPDFRRIPRRKGRRDARGRRDGHLSPRGAAVLRRVAGDTDGLALRVAGLDGRRMLLPRLHPHIAQSQRIDGFRGVLVRDRHPADLHPPQEHRTAEGGNRVEDLHLEAAARETRRRGAEKERQRARSGITGSGLFDEIIRIKG